MENNRIHSLDILRGFGIMLIILFHTSIYNFANIHKLDFSNPPIIIIIMSFMALWGGVFIVYSTTVNSIKIAQRNQNDNNIKTFLYLTYAVGIYLIMHYILNIFLGRWNVDFENNKPDMTVVASSMRKMKLSFPHLTKFFEGSSISTIAWNLLIVSWVLYFLLKKSAKQARNYLILGSAGFIILILSFVRVSLYSQFTEAVDTNNYFMSIVYSFVLSNPYPIITYLSYGFFGALIGLMIYNKRRDLLKKVIIPLGMFFLIFGVYGAMQFDKTISTPDYFWYFKTNFELGIFLLAISGIYLAFEHKKKIGNRMKILRLFSRISLTIYMSETFLSEILRYIVKPIFPNWDQTINGCLLFGVFNILVWTGIILLWKKSNFKYSLEYFWVKIFAKMGKKSTKIDF